MAEVKPKKYTKEVWLFAYDLATEQIAGLDKDTKHWLEAKRVNIWYQLRFTFRCARLQKSLWLVRDLKQLNKLQQIAGEWLQEYRSKGFSGVLIEIFPIGTTEQGYGTFMEWEVDCIFAWMREIEECIEKRIQGKIFNDKQFHNTTERKLELLTDIITEDCKTHKRYKEAESQLLILHDKLYKMGQRKVDE